MNVFDIIGPVMIGPSSSHTAGAVRLGRVAWKILEEEPKRVDILLAGSFAETYKGHGTDKALLAGCMGMHAYQREVRDALKIADEKGIAYSFTPVSIPGAHPNTAVITLTGTDGKKVTVKGASIGGANIEVEEVNGMPVMFTGRHDTYLVRHHDTTGVIAAVTNYMMFQGLNISNFRLSRKNRDGEALLMIEVEGTAPREILEHMKELPNVISAILIRAV